MIRNALFAPAAGVVRAVIRGVGGLLQALASMFPWSPVRRLFGHVAFLLEALSEYALYVLGWIGWVLDWIFRLPALALCLNGHLARGHLPVRGVVLMDEGADPAAAFAQAQGLLRDADVLLGRSGIALVPRSLVVRPRPKFLTSVPCGVAGIFSRFFAWASSRAGGSPALTIYFAEQLGRVVGCAYPGTDWIVVDIRGDGATVVHELGHLADLWRHTLDPDNVMTDRHGGAQDQITARQRAMIRTCRFVGRIPPAEIIRPRPLSQPGPFPKG